MIRKSGYRFSEKDHAQTKSWSAMMIRREVIALQNSNGGFDLPRKYLPKSALFARRSVAPGVRFWHGPADLGAALLGRAGLLFMRPAASCGDGEGRHQHLRQIL
jgi:hypothetical protein